MNGEILKRLRRFLAFYYSPWGAAKGERWESFTNDHPLTDDSAVQICQLIMAGHEFNWDELPELKED